MDQPLGDLNHDAAITDAEVNVQWSNTNVNELWQGDASEAEANDEAHFYAECSNRGACNAGTGECQCFPGYTGSACQRSLCPSSCSGHGVCRTISEIAANKLTKHEVRSANGQRYYEGVVDSFTYGLWDADMSQACVCDPGYTGYDCSMRECPRGDDPLTSGQRYCGNEGCADAKMSFSLTAAAKSTIRFGFKAWDSRTYYTYATVDGLNNAGGDISGTQLPGLSTNSGIMMQALRAMPGGFLLNAEVNSRDFSDDTQACNAGNKCTYYVAYKAPGTQELMSVSVVEGTAVVDDEQFVTDSGVTLDGNTERITCSGRGMCDYSSGLCNCFGGYYGGACEYQNALSGGGSASRATVLPTL